MINSNDPKLTAYVLGELDDEERAAVEAEINGSPELQETVKGIREATELLTAQLGAQSTPSLTDDQREEIHEKSAKSGPSSVEDAPAVERPAGDHRRRFVALFVAASLLILAVGIAALIQFGPQISSSVVSLQSSADDDADLSIGFNDLSDTEEMLDADVQAFEDSTSSDGVGYSSGDLGPTADGAIEFGAVEGTEVAGRGRAMREDIMESRLPPAESPEPSTNPHPIPLPAGTDEAIDGRGHSSGGAGGGRATRPSGPTPGPRPANSNSTPAGGDGEPAAIESDPNIAAASDDSSGDDGANPGDSPVAFEGTDGQRQLGDKEEGQERGAGRNKNESSTKVPGGKGKEPAKTWKRVKAIPNTSRLMVGDRDELPMEGLQANVVIDGFRARVLLDCYFYNNHSSRLEGSFKLRLPDDASLYYFAFGETSFEYRPMVNQLASNGFIPADVVRSSGTGPAEILKARDSTWASVKEARMVPREKAAHAYSETVRRRVDPALVEWSGAGVFNARVFPLMPNKLHRIVVGYDVNLQQDGDDLVYKLQLPAEVEQRMIDLNVAASPGASVELNPTAQPFTAGGRAYFNFKDPHENTIEVRYKDPGTVMLQGADETGNFFATRISPELPKGEANVGSTHGIFLVDTSLSSNPDKFNAWLKLLETTLDENRDKMSHFAVLFFNIESHWWKRGFTENTPENVEKLVQFCNTLSLEGATDLKQALARAVQPTWMPDGELPFEGKPDVFLLSDGAVTWGELNLQMIGRTFKRGWGGTLFAYKTGLTGTSVATLEHLARETGGAVFSVVTEEEIQKAATAHRSRPWQLVDTSVTDGSSDVLIAGRIRSIYSGQSLLLVGRGQPRGEVGLKFRRGDERKTINVRLNRTIESNLTPRLYGQVAVGQLESLKSATENVSTAYARHFRVTGQTCSLLMLESEADYQRFNIKPEDDAAVVKVSQTRSLIERKIDEIGESLQDPKAAVVAWLRKLESLPGFQFKTPTLLNLALDQMPGEAFEVEVPQLVCEHRVRSGLPKKYFEAIQQSRLDYDTVNEESIRRSEEFSAADALKSLSSLIENNPGDPILTQDVAFSAIDWKLGGQAYPLLKRVAVARPYQPQIYQAIGHCLTELGNADLAMVYYEVALNGKWHNRYKDIHRIASVEYLHLLSRVAAGELETSVPDYAKARLDTLKQSTAIGNPDLIVTMMWNTDRTDVDLHVLEPSGEECYYKNPNTRSGGKITADVTEGFGPEMYVLNKVKSGKYTIKANYYGSDANRTQARSKVYVTVYENFGTPRDSVSRKTVLLSRNKEMRELTAVYIK